VLKDIKQVAQDHVNAALKSLDVLLKTEYRSSLEDTLDFVTARSN
jgi:geranylgeranyl pyrophosphate synthase